jgi:hypothetical protein
VLALAVAAVVGGTVFVGGAADGGKFLSTIPTVYLTFVNFCSFSEIVVFVALGYGAVLNEEFTVFELPITKQDLLHKSVSFH